MPDSCVAGCMWVIGLVSEKICVVGQDQNAALLFSGLCIMRCSSPSLRIGLISVSLLPRVATAPISVSQGSPAKQKGSVPAWMDLGVCCTKRGGSDPQPTTSASQWQVSIPTHPIPSHLLPRPPPALHQDQPGL